MVKYRADRRIAWEMTMKTALIAAAILCVAGPSLADTPPLLRPSKDVAVEYRMGDATALGRGPGTSPGTSARTAVMHYTDHGNKMRFDMMSGRGYGIFDYGARRVTIVMNEKKMYMEHALEEDETPMAKLADAHFTRKGTDTVAGLSCAVYDVENDGNKTEACVTDDGIVLRARGEAGDASDLRMEALKVTYGPQPASLFVPPADFQKLDLSAMQHGLKGPGRMPPGMAMPPGTTAPTR